MKIMSAREAWIFLQDNRNAMLIDVRTPEEWVMTGFPDMTSLGTASRERKAYGLTWMAAGGGNEEETRQAMERFARNLRTLQPDRTIPLLFLCRSGMRSHYAGQLAAHLGYQNVINIGDGFENHHGAGTGWRDAPLPFTFSLPDAG